MKPRNVMFKKWIPAEYINEGIFKKSKEGTNCWENDFTHHGYFLHWGISYDSFENGIGNYTVAIIELPDGTIEEVVPTNLKFLD